jgi:hypothetical protein
MNELTPSQKGAAAEAELAAALIRLNLFVLRPVGEGGRYDLAIDTGAGILRVQCKWASRRGNVLTARCNTSRHTPRGYLRSKYTADEIDAIAAYSPDTDRCYLIPVEETEGHVTLSLRLTPTGNNQAERVRWAHDYELASSLERHWARWGAAIRPGEDSSRPIG